jgi:hypothetical protein
MNLPDPTFFDFARGNSFANFEHLKSEYGKLSEIDAEMVVKNLNHTGFSAAFQSFKLTRPFEELCVYCLVVKLRKPTRVFD